MAQKTPGGRTLTVPRLVSIKGCGTLVCSTYAEIADAVDRSFDVPKDRPLPIQAAFESLAADARQGPSDESGPSGTALGTGA
jgi:hypothetical protein